MKPHYRDIIKHSGVYGFGQVLRNLASVLMLPVHTHYLTPADYGCFAILDLTVGVFSVLISGGMAAALNRYHFDAQTREEENAVWWTGLAVVAGMATLVTVPALVVRGLLAHVTLGPEVTLGGYFYALALPTLWCNVVSNVPNQYMRVRKWSWQTVALSLASLLFNIGLNVYFLVVLHMGVAGILLGNLIAAILTVAVRVGILAHSCRTRHINWSVALHLVRFGSPIVLTGLLTLMMHYADRYVLRLFVDLEQIGFYSLAYTLGQGLNGLVLIPFSMIWAVVIYDIAKEPNAKQSYARVFEYFVYALTLLLLGISLFVKPLLALFAPPAYAAAAPLVPIVCLAFVFFSLDEHFKVPALLAKRTVSLVPAYAVGAIANVVLNITLVPIFGIVAAAWTSVATYAIFAGGCLLQVRRIDRFPYRLWRTTAVLLAMVASYIACRLLESVSPPVVGSLVVPGLVLTAWAVALSYPLLRRQTHFQRVAAVSPSLVSQKVDRTSWL